MKLKSLDCFCLQKFSCCQKNIYERCEIRAQIPNKKRERERIYIRENKV